MKQEFWHDVNSRTACEGLIIAKISKHKIEAQSEEGAQRLWHGKNLFEKPNIKKILSKDIHLKDPDKVSANSFTISLWSEVRLPLSLRIIFFWKHFCTCGQLNVDSFPSFKVKSQFFSFWIIWLKLEDTEELKKLFQRLAFGRTQNL